MKLMQVLSLVAVFLSGCSQSENPKNDKENAKQANGQVVQEQEEKQENEQDVIVLKGTQKLKNGEDLIEFKDSSLMAGNRVLNLASNQQGTVTGDIVILLKENGVAPEIQGLKIVERGKIMVRYRADSSTDLLLAFRKLQADSWVKTTEIQVDYTPISNTNETM